MPEYKFKLDDPDVRELFLGLVAEAGNITKACKICGLGRKTVYSHAERDATFKQDLDRARLMGIDGLEDEAIRRAYDGVEKPVVHQGKVIFTVREYSDSLLKMILKGWKPHRYAERKVISGPNDGPILLAAMDVSRLTLAIQEARALPAPIDGEVIDVPT
jgi:hypothetical protein